MKGRRTIYKKAETGKKIKIKKDPKQIQRISWDGRPNHLGKRLRNFANNPGNKKKGETFFSFPSAGLSERLSSAYVDIVERGFPCIYRPDYNCIVSPRLTFSRCVLLRTTTVEIYLSFI